MRLAVHRGSLEWMGLTRAPFGDIARPNNALVKLKLTGFVSMSVA